LPVLSEILNGITRLNLIFKLHHWKRKFSSTFMVRWIFFSNLFKDDRCWFFGSSHV